LLRREGSRERCNAEGIEHAVAQTENGAQELSLHVLLERPFAIVQACLGPLEQRSHFIEVANASLIRRVSTEHA